jgi:preprotein translocase subunit SecB
MQFASSSLRLERYFVAESAFIAKPAQVTEAKRLLKPNDLVITTGVRCVDAAAGRWQLTLGVTHSEAAFAEGYMAFRVKLVGLFVVPPEIPGAEGLLRINGFSVLYGAAREYVEALTGRGPYGAVMLPTIAFQWDGEQDSLEQPGLQARSSR